MIRRATLSDVPRLVEILEWAQARSIYAGKVAVDRQEANRLLVNAVQRHGGRGEMGTWVTAAEIDGEVEGFIVGCLQRVLHVGDRCQAVDLMWLTTEKASARDSVGLVLGMVDWAEAHPKAIEVVCGVTGTMGDWQKAGGILQRMGLDSFGGMYRRTFNDRAEAA